MPGKTERNRFVLRGVPAPTQESMCRRCTANLAPVKTFAITFDTRPRNWQQERCFRVQSFEGSPSFAPAQRSGDCESQVMETHVAGCIHASRAFHASSQVRLIWPLIVPPHANAKSFNLPLLVTVSVAILRDRILRGHSLAITTSSRGTCRTSAVLVVGGSSECGLLRLRVRGCVMPGTAAL